MEELHDVETNAVDLDLDVERLSQDVFGRRGHLRRVGLGALSSFKFLALELLALCIRTHLLVECFSKQPRLLFLLCRLCFFSFLPGL